MIVPLMSTVITFNAAGGAARNPATRATVPINLAEFERHPFPGRRPTLSLRAMRDRQRHGRTNRLPLALANQARTSVATAPSALSP
jgi:hypothetical protein